MSCAIEAAVGAEPAIVEPRLRMVSDAPPPRVVKRYGNRKLYDTAISRYVKLEEIADLVRDGVEVRVVEHGSGRDITTAALAHIIFGEEAARAKRSAGVLADVIRGRADPARGVASGDGATDEVARRAEARLHQALNQAHRASAGVTCMVSATHGTLERLRATAAARTEVAHEVCDGLGRARRDLERLARRLDELHHRLRTLDC